jgi:hypothetical protein
MNATLPRTLLAGAGTGMLCQAFPFHSMLMGVQLELLGCINVPTAQTSPPGPAAIPIRSTLAAGRGKGQIFQAVPFQCSRKPSSVVPPAELIRT